MPILTYLQRTNQLVNASCLTKTLPILLWLLCAGICSASARQPAGAANRPALDDREAGSAVPCDEIARSGAEPYFEILPVDDARFARMQGKSFKADCPLSRDELRVLRVLHYDFDEHVRIGELVCHRTIADELLAIFRTLYDARYPIARMVPIDAYDADDERSMEANNSSSFNFRFIAGTRRISKHGQGLAVDINPLFNPCVRKRGETTVVEPAAGAPYADRTHDFPGKIDRDDLCCQLFIAHGFTWGGDWQSLKDYQHFEK